MLADTGLAVVFGSYLVLRFLNFALRIVTEKKAFRNRQTTAYYWGGHSTSTYR
jgi:hypothetical protein